MLGGGMLGGGTLGKELLGKDGRLVVGPRPGRSSRASRRGRRRGRRFRVAGEERRGRDGHGVGVAVVPFNDVADHFNGVFVDDRGQGIVAAVHRKHLHTHHGHVLWQGVEIDPFVQHNAPTVFQLFVLLFVLIRRVEPVSSSFDHGRGWGRIFVHGPTIDSGNLRHARIVATASSGRTKGGRHGGTGGGGQGDDFGDTFSFAMVGVGVSIGVSIGVGVVLCASNVVVFNVYCFSFLVGVGGTCCAFCAGFGGVEHCLFAP